MVEFIENNKGRLAYSHTCGHGPHVIFLGGYMSSMEGTKACYFEKICQTQGVPYTRFDYMGHGASSGHLENASISQWLDNIATIIEHINAREHILIGSSLGGWLMLLTALKKQYSILGLMGIAAAPDFTVDIHASLSEDQKKTLTEKGHITTPSRYGMPYVFAKTLLDDAKHHLVLKKPLNFSMPVHLFHGTEDVDVPLDTYGLPLFSRIKSPDTHMHIIDGGDHGLSAPEQLDCMGGKLIDLCR